MEGFFVDDNSHALRIVVALSSSTQNYTSTMFLQTASGTEIALIFIFLFILALGTWIYGTFVEEPRKNQSKSLFDFFFPVVFSVNFYIYIIRKK